jgi:hypothetical protein
MKLPNAEKATVPEEKITQYLLNSGHPAGGSKAAFFLRFGFRVEEWRLFASALIRHALENEIVESEETQYGTRYAVDGPLPSPSSVILNVRTAWFIDLGGDFTALRNCPSAGETMNTIKELDAVALTADLPAHALRRGDVGTVVLVHGNGEAYEVEFVGYDGHTVALLTLERDAVRSLQATDIPHARSLEAA